MEKKNQERSIELKKKTTSKLKVKKNNHRLGKEKQKKSLEVFLKNKNYLYVIVVVINILFTIFMARQNKINYVNITGRNVMLGENNYLYFGRNYINLVIIGFFSIYTMLLRRFLIKKKLTWKFVILTLIFYFILDIILFCIFTKRIF